ncbi:MAG: aminotransferase class III-fold pyridoxal phosphate-dependent enzyme, partial [Nitrosopumilus sp.]|nr:aminotransferase class III-fold pyridoxal phosphate-dependent enzyme [Nitrosopumilus sp.]
EPLVEKVSFASFGDIESLRSVVNDDTAFVILEPIQGESGIIVAPDGFLQDVRKLCDEKGILLIFDEIQAGLGRTGRLWACEHWNTVPDILCLAKGIAGGVPMGATLVRSNILASMSKGEHSSTFGGNPLSCAAGTAALKALTEDGLIENAEKMGKIFREGLEKLKENHNMIREIRGKGLMIGIEMKFEVRDILMGLMKKGVLMLYSGRNILRILPPLVISEEDITKVLHALDSVLGEEEQKKVVQR